MKKSEAEGGSDDLRAELFDVVLMFVVAVVVIIKKNKKKKVSC